MIKFIVLLLPTQLGFHFWPSFSRVAGIKVDYLSPTIYLLDIFLILFVVLNISKVIRYLKKKLHTLGILIFFIVINIIFSVSPPVSIFWWSRLLLYFLVFLVIRLRKTQWMEIRSPLLCGTIFVVILEISQLIFQSSLGGSLYFFGERTFSSSTPGIGRFNLFGQEILRPISTFSHSNSLAGYLLIVFYLFYKKPSPSWYKIIPFIGILLTFSKTAIVALAFIIFNLKSEIVIVLSLLLTLTQPFIQNIVSEWQSISDRLFYIQYFKKIFFNNSIFGVGLGNFIPSLGSLLPGSFITPSKLQPIHNIFFLYLSELGIIGSLLLIFTLIKYKILKFLSNPLIFGLIAIVLFTGALDHYTWTLPQNKLILILALAIIV